VKRNCQVGNAVTFAVRKTVYFRFNLSFKFRLMKFFNYSTLSALIVAGALLSCNQPATEESIAEAKPEETGEIKVVSTLSFPDGKYIVDNGTST